MKPFSIRGLYYITHIENLRSILDRGIMSHEMVEQDKVPFTPIYDASIVGKRREKSVSGGQSLWHYANFYFQPRNPMMYRIIHEKDRRNIAVVGVKPDVVNQPGVFLSDGNAASGPTSFFNPSEGMQVIQKQWKDIQSDWWNDLNGTKRRIMAECLIPGKISSESIHTIYVCDPQARSNVQKLLPATKIPVVPEPHMFFQPSRQIKIGKNISLIDGDMFFSNMHALTVSVNLQGIMGKGLASRAKYQFPDVYVFYQDACRAKRITAIRPCIYKREASLDQELADLTTPLNTPNSVKWFLLFATKRKWRDNSRMDDIEAGLSWLRDNAKKEGIRSLAMPALGCGLGGLTWAEVGPLMCRSLHGIGMDVAIYLPREDQAPPEYLTASYLLGD